MNWTYDTEKKYWCASRPMDGESNADFIYCIKDIGDGRYIADAQNNAYGATRVAVENQSCTSASEFNDLEKLKRDIENKNILWLYTGACNCIGLITFDEL